MSPWRQARAIALLPGTVTVLVPAIVLIVFDDPQVGWGMAMAPAVLTVTFGAALIAAGLAVWFWTARLFARIGKGTLAPWDPTSHLVVVGPYRRMRNPMITAVLAILLGEAILFGSLLLFAWCATFFVANHLFFVLREEPGLERRFGDEYRRYRRAVPRWLPRRSP